MTTESNLPNVFVAEICFDTYDAKDDYEARDLLYHIIEHIKTHKFNNKSIISASIEDIYEIENI